MRVAEIVGGRGSMAGQFNFPTGLAVDGLGILYVADSYNHRIQRITPTGEVAVIGGRGSGKGRFLSPQGIATDAARAFYICEQGNHRVQKYSANGVLEMIFGRPGARDGELRNPTGIAVAPCSGDIFVADTGNARVQRFDCDGNFLTSIGGRGGVYTALISPQALSVDVRDHLYVVDTFAHRIIQYDPLGRPVARFRHVRLREPRSVACTSAGVLYVTDLDPTEATGQEPIGRMQALDSLTGELRSSLKPTPQLGNLLQPGGLAAPLAYDKHPGADELTEVYVADTMNHRILRVVWN
jgi:sugar lactone lactonase YvrE